MPLIPSYRSSLAAAIFGLLVQATCASAQETVDPAHDVENPLRYIPNIPAAIVTGVIYLLTVGIFLVWYRRHPGRYMLTVIIAGICYAIGLFIRPAFAKSPHSVNVLVVMNMFTILSPCGFIATVYMLLSRLSIHLQAEDLLIIKPSILTKLFVTSDVITLLIQAGGGGLQSAKTESSAKLGKTMFLVGLVAQLISFILYMVVFLVFIYRIKTKRSEQWNTRPSGLFKHWLALVCIMGVSCVGILIRSVFRTIENVQGFDGYLATHEGYFYALDCLPLWIAVV
ncbi:hypothetical protein BDV93DRAFT_452081 [Ceratobasidium sp. AG-I]|nr:hypothetical protein BDV93DRAFT_452081 [Ceratobasidium sp. AG-I]